MMETIIKRPRKIGQPITENILTCLKCGHVHDEDNVIKHYNKRNVGNLSCLCDKCYYPMKLTRTTRGFYVFSNQSHNRRYCRIDWSDIFRDCKIEISEELRDWLITNYVPPRKVRSKSLIIKPNEKSKF